MPLHPEMDLSAAEVIPYLQPNAMFHMKSGALFLGIRSQEISDVSMVAHIDDATCTGVSMSAIWAPGAGRPKQTFAYQIVAQVAVQNHPGQAHVAISGEWASHIR